MGESFTGPRVQDILKQLRPFLGSRVDQLYQAYLLEDKDGKAQLELYFQGLLAQNLGSASLSEPAVLVPPAPEAAGGPYELGTIVYGGRPYARFGLREDEWIQHLGIFGRSGAGKTNVGFLVLDQLQRHQKPFLLFDWKRNYRDLISRPGFEDLEIYTIGRPFAPLTFNPLVPPAGTPPKTWLKKVIEVIAHAYGLGNGVLYLLQQTLDSVYARFGVYSGSPERYPTFQDVLDELRAYPAKGREAGWLSSTLRAMAALCFGDMETVVNRGQNTHIEALLQKPVILELEALTQADKIFFIQALLLWIHHFRMAEGFRETFKHAIVIEEAHHVLSGERHSLIGGQSVMEITFREIREFGESVIILDQHPSQISLPALGNTYTTICLNLKHSKDVSAMGQAMLLEGPEKDLLGSLPVGQAVVKLQGRVSRPFQISVPEFPIRKGSISDEVVASRPRTAPSQVRSSDSPVGRIAHKIGASLRSPEVPSQPTVSPGESRILQFLKDIGQFPESGVAARYRRLGVSVRQGQKLKAELANAGLLEEALETIPTGVLRVLRLTEKGRATLPAEELSEADGR